MLDADVAARWGKDPRFIEQLGRWRWFRDAMPPLLRDCATAAGATGPVRIDTGALGKAFWAWAAALERDGGFEALDRLDFAHFLSGQLLHQWIVHRPLVLPDAERSREMVALTRAAMTVLAAWRIALGAPIHEVQAADEQSEHWPSYLENTAEDPGTAVAFLDLFAGLEPVWQAPLLVAERPAVRRALAHRVETLASGAEPAGQTAAAQR